MKRVPSLGELKTQSSGPRLTLVGVGPGDPSLMTLSAVKEIGYATTVAYPVSKPGERGLAASIASHWITEEKHRLPLVFPMVSDEDSLRNAWRKATDQIALAVATGERVVLLCQGDVSLFASSSYVLLDLQARYPQCPVNLVPGVTAISAAAAIGAWPLSLQKDQLLVLPTPDEPRKLEEILENAEKSGQVLALLKLGHRWAWVRELLEEKDLLHGSLFAQRVGFPDQKVMRANEVKEGQVPYFSLLLIRQSWPNIVP